MIEKGFKTPEDLTGKVLSVTGTSANTELLAADAEDVFVDLVSTVNVWIRIASTGTPTAVVGTSYFMVANATYRFPVSKGARIAAIKDTGEDDGSLYIHPVK